MVRSEDYSITNMANTIRLTGTPDGKYWIRIQDHELGKTVRQLREQHHGVCTTVIPIPSAGPPRLQRSRVSTQQDLNTTRWPVRQQGETRNTMIVKHYAIASLPLCPIER